MMPRPVRKKLARTVYVSEEQDQVLRRVSDQDRVPVARLIREALDRAISAWADDGRSLLARADRLASTEPEEVGIVLRQLVDRCRKAEAARDKAQQKLLAVAVKVHALREELK